MAIVPGMSPDDIQALVERRKQEDIANFVNHAGYEDGLPFVKKYLAEKGRDALEQANSKGETAFLRAADHGRIEIMDYLAEQGANTEVLKNGRSLPHWLARYGGNRVAPSIAWLIAHGFPVNARDGETGPTLLLAAAHTSCPELIAVLVAAGADVDARDARGNTPLMISAMVGAVQNLRALAENGANIEAKSDNGDTALKHALVFSNAKSVAALLALGANMHATDGRGVTALDYAARKRLRDLFDTETQRRCDAVASAIAGGITTEIKVGKLRLKSPTARR